MDKNTPYARRPWITTALSLRFNDALTYREIAEQLNISTSATHKMFKRFRRTGINWPLPEEYTPERLEELYAFNLECQKTPSGLASGVQNPHGGAKPAAGCLCGRTGAGTWR
ncbi:winged helix-turn-helix transcriptional regulator [Kosakonia sp. S42]|uniref:winged helix-turn-helix transcriptional regulator n=1 Tax=Kosakonia sp. S42 TaxID=2767458 RepID=UPI00190BCCC1|nr:winged helix-turn-helix transcriptional regulator [Kosakonia sp. S42]MBK0019498.1 winged helix-turn-helix domain-containing protein [Kosakonia sp. S42]